MDSMNAATVTLMIEEVHVELPGDALASNIYRLEPQSLARHLKSDFRSTTATLFDGSS